MICSNRTFRCWSTRVGARATIEVFTSLEGLAAAYPDLPYVTLPFPVLMALLPEPGRAGDRPWRPGQRELRDAALALLMLHLAEHRTPDTDRAQAGQRSACPWPGRHRRGG